MVAEWRFEHRINKQTTGKYDTTPLLYDAESFTAIVHDLARPYVGQNIDKVVGLESLGFSLGAAVALHLGVGFVALRKKGNLPTVSSHTEEIAFVDYSSREKGFVINTTAIEHGDRILLVDDWLETGAQMQAARTLVERLGGVVVGVSVLHADACPVADALRACGLLHTLRTETRRVRTTE